MDFPKPGSDTAVTIQPLFIVNDLEKVKEFMTLLYAAIPVESKLLHYGFSISKDGKRVFCREAY